MMPETKTGLPNEEDLRLIARQMRSLNFAQRVELLCRLRASMSDQTERIQELETIVLPVVEEKLGKQRERIQELESQLAARAESDAEHDAVIEYSRKIRGRSDVHSVYEVLDWQFENWKECVGRIQEIEVRLTKANHEAFLAESEAKRQKSWADLRAKRIEQLSAQLATCRGTVRIMDETDKGLDIKCDEQAEEIEQLKIQLATARKLIEELRYANAPVLTEWDEEADQFRGAMTPDYTREEFERDQCGQTGTDLSTKAMTPTDKYALSADNWGNCECCGKYQDLRMGCCFHCSDFVDGKKIPGGHELWDTRNPSIRWQVKTQ